MCEMAAHYKVKYGLQGLEKTLTMASKRFSRSSSNDYGNSNSPSTDIKRGQNLASSLPNLLADDLGDSKTDDDTGDDIPYMVMHPQPKQNLQHSLSLEKLNLETTPSPLHKALTYSSSSSARLSYLETPSSRSQSTSIRTPNGYLQSPKGITERTFSGGHPTIYENTPTDNVFNGKHFIFQYFLCYKLTLCMYVHT